eukprot:2833784-Pyramimonas_sp.AAC.2
MLRQHAPQIPAMDMPPPSNRAIVRVLERARPSAPGPDNLPCEAWKAAPGGADMLYDSMMWMLDGHSLGYEYNHMLGVFAPKGSEEGDESGAIRTAGHTRPLGLKNADNKIITAAC